MKDLKVRYTEVAKLLFLGTGASMGVPIIGCHCAVCRSDHPKNSRMRSSLLLSIENKRLLIDCSPDFRQQALQYPLLPIDGVLLTHAHRDHTGGLDDLRALFLHRQEPLPLLLHRETYEELKRQFHYLFDPALSSSWSRRFDLQILSQPEGKREFLGLPISYFSFFQAGARVLGFRFQHLAYVTDIREYEERIFESLQGVETLIVSALRFVPSPMHFSIDEALSFFRQSGAKRGWLVHMAHEIDHEKVNVYLPSELQLAYDGLEIDF